MIQIMFSGTELSVIDNKLVINKIIIELLRITELKELLVSLLK